MQAADETSELNSVQNTKNSKNSSKKGLIFGVLLVSIGGWLLFSSVSSLFDNTMKLIAPNGVITVEVSDTHDTRAKGLSGHEPLDESQGMLFVFDQISDKNCFWMKDMTFAIDMLWLDESKQVITVKSNVEPSTYPETFCPESPAKYGLELSSGRAESVEIIPGSKLRW